MPFDVHKKEITSRGCIYHARNHGHTSRENLASPKVNFLSCPELNRGWGGCSDTFYITQGRFRGVLATFLLGGRAAGLSSGVGTYII
jgi:hypothetical protein